jgi:hypothetical protein
LFILISVPSVRVARLVCAVGLLLFCSQAGGGLHRRQPKSIIRCALAKPTIACSGPGLNVPGTRRNKNLRP